MRAQAALAAGIAESMYLPNLTASAVGAYQDNSTHNSGSGFSGNGNNSAHGVISAVSLNWLLFDFGERAALVNVAKQGAVISNIDFTAVHQQLIYNVSLAYYTDEAARDHVATAAQSLETAKTVQAAAEDRYAARRRHRDRGRAGPSGHGAGGTGAGAGHAAARRMPIWRCSTRWAFRP